MLREENRKILHSIFILALCIASAVAFIKVLEFAESSMRLIKKKGNLNRTEIPFKERYDDYCYFSDETKTEVCEYTKWDGTEKYRCYFNAEGGRQCDLIETSEEE